MSSEPLPDYLITGAGLCGCVLASRLSLAGHSVLLLESGSTPASPDPAVLSSASAFTIALTNPELIHQYTSVPQKALNDRCIPIQAGHTLGGGSAVNYAAWTRGHRADYDAWAELVGDEGWGYEGMLPAFKASENYEECKGAAREQHGFGGPIALCSGPRGYPLEKQAREAMLSTGMEWNPDMNSGDPNGVARLIESWDGGVRQFAGKDYDLSGVEIRGDAQVAKVLIEDGRAVGVQLGSGEKLYARKEVIVCCGAVRTPQLLMLSGVGTAEELEELGIPVKADLPVGRGLWDHGSFHLNFMIKEAEVEKGVALGAPGFKDPKFFEGAVIDFFASGMAEDDELRRAAEIDGVGFEEGKARTDFEIACAYAPGPPIPGHAPAPCNGSISKWSLAILSPTSRGSITLSSTSPTSSPLIDPAYFSTAHDLTVMRSGIRTILRMTESDAGRSFLDGEVPPDPAMKPLTSASSDEELDERLRAHSASFYHLAGTAAMGRAGGVVDTRCMVKGVKGLRVVDASVLPVGVGAHLQAPLYAVAERVAGMIIEGE